MTEKNIDINLQKKRELEYIYEMLVKLGRIAKKSDQTSVAYFIEMAALEALDKAPLHPAASALTEFLGSGPTTLTETLLPAAAPDGAALRGAFDTAAG